MRIGLVLLVLALAGFYASPSKAQEALAKADFSELRIDPVRIKPQTVIDPLTFTAENGTVYRLTGLDVPGMESGGSDITAEAVKKLKELVEGQELKIYTTKTQELGRQNRMGQSLIHAVRQKDDLWLQGQLVADGLARVRTTPSNPQMVRQLLALEDGARKQRKGLWADKQYAIMSADTVEPKANTFAIVEGKVFSAATRNNETFLNFSPDWKKDFSIGISSEMRRALARKGIDFQNLAHKTVRVRGFIEERNGPFISLDHPEQLEVIGAIAAPIDEPSSPGLKTMKVPEAPKTPEVTEPEKPDVPAKKPERTHNE